MDNEVLYSFLDTINHDILDDELILQNQLACIKRLINGSAFSISEL